jgi:hypothetical protein
MAFSRELTGLELRLYQFLDDVDTIVEYPMTESRWELMRQKMKKCKEDCKVSFGVVNNGYSLHVELPFDADKDIPRPSMKINN